MSKKICYVRGEFQSFNHPAHKRRFPKFAKRLKIDYSDYLNGRQIGDVNVLSPAADLTFWNKVAKKSNYSIIFDANDPYLLSGNNSFRDRLRGVFKYLSGSHKFLEFDYLESYMKLCKSSNVVITGHINQSELLRRNGVNVLRIPDYGIDGELNIKANFNLSSDGKINVFWEGLGSSFKPFKIINDIFADFEHKERFIFHFVTDLIFWKYGDKFGKTWIQNIAKAEAPHMYDQFRFYQWSEHMMNTIAVACDLCMIPLPMDYSLNYWKPENKLVHMWRMGIPTIVTPIPSYIDIINKSAQKNCYASEIGQWREIIHDLISSSVMRKQLAETGYEYAKLHYSDEIIDELWKNVFKDI